MTEVESKKNEIVLVQGQLKKIIHQQGQGDDSPQSGQQVFALYKGTLQDGTQFDSNQSRDDPFKFTIGQGQVIKGWDQGFASMKKGQKATLICSPDFAYGAKGSPPRIPPNSTLHFQVELLDFKDKKKEKWEMSSEQKVQEATKLKNSGNQHLKNGDLANARKDYKQGAQYVDAEQDQSAKNMLKILRLNNSQACLQAKAYGECIQDCSKVLKQDADNQKALYRRGNAYLNNQDFDLAEVDLQHLVKIDPQNKAAKNLLGTIAIKKKEFEKKQKKVFSSMFSKPLYEDKKPQPPKQQPKDEGMSSDEEFKPPQSPNKQEQKSEKVQPEQKANQKQDMQVETQKAQTEGKPEN